MKGTDSMNKQHWHPAFCGAAEWELKKKVRRDKNMCEALRDLMKDEIAAERAAERSETTEKVTVTTTLDNIKKMMKNLKITAVQAMQALEIPESEQAQYAAKL